MTLGFCPFRTFQEFHDGTLGNTSIDTIDTLAFSRLNRRIRSLRFGIASASRLLFALLQRFRTQAARCGFEQCQVVAYAAFNLAFGDSTREKSA